MRTTERFESKPSATTGPFATLRASLRPKGTRARPHSRASITAFATLLTLSAFLLTATPAFANPPETPLTGVAEPTTTTAVLHGTLNPGAPGLPGSYQFSYAPSLTSECSPGTLAPASPAFATGTLAEEVEVTLTGLEPNKEYAFCVIAYSLSFEASSPSAAVPFKTNPAPPTLGVEKTSAVTSTAATLEAELNPNSESTTYTFEYSTTESGGVLTGTIVKVAGAAPLEGGSLQTGSVPLTALSAGTTYFYRVVAENAQSVIEAKPVQGAVQSFTTLATPHTEEVKSITATTAMLHGTLTPLTETVGAEAEYSFDYNVGSEDCTGAGTTTLTGAGSGTGPKAVEAEATGLQPGATYSVCLVSSNAFGSEVDPFSPQVHFTTLAGPPSILSETSSALTPEGATLEASVNPNNQETTCSFEYGTEPLLTSGVTTVPCSKALGSGGSLVTGSAAITHLNLKTIYYYRAVAENVAHEKTTDPTIEHFETENTVAPTIASEEATSITEHTATLTAKLNPNGSEVSSCTFEYGTKSGVYPTKVPCAALPGSGRSPVAVSAALSKLSPNKEYHWRLQATNAAGTTTTLDQTFSDPVSTAPESCPNAQLRKENGSLALPDCRAYEMVTPPEKNGTLIGEVFIGQPHPQIAENGARVIAVSIGCFEGAQSCVPSRQEEGVPYEFTRTPHGWVTHPLAPPATTFPTYSTWSDNANADTALFSIPAPSGKQEAFWAEKEGTFTDIGPLEEEGTRPEGEPGYEAFAQGQLISTANLSHVLYPTKGRLWAFDPTEGHSLYEYAGTHNAAPLLVGVKGGYENGENHELISGCDTAISPEREGAKFDGPLSADGRTVYFTALGRDVNPECATNHPTAPPKNALYARVDGELPDAHSVLISGPTPASCTIEPCTKDSTAEEDARDAHFEGASADGSRAFFSSTQQLTDNASQDEGENLYESVCAEPCGTPAEEPDAKERQLIDVSESAGGATVPGGPRVQGVEAISADGSHVYFVAQGVLTGEQENQNHEKANDGEDNLYVYGEGRVAFIATLAPSDERQNWELEAVRIANVTPNGRFLVFTSHRALTADDTREGGPAQVFEYDAQTGLLTRISIGQEGFNDNGNDGTGDASIVEANSQGPAAGSVPVRSDPTMSSNGAFVFFRSPVALTPGALNDVVVRPAEPEEGRPTVYAQNFYEYHEGHVSLISDGKDTTGAGQVSESVKLASATSLLGSDVSGANVFFSTFDRLVPGDTDSQRDFYDARTNQCVNGAGEGKLATGSACGEGEHLELSGFPAPVLSTPCEGEACYPAGQGPGSEQSRASESFTGPGNLAPPAPAVAKPKTAAQVRAEKLAKALKACRKKTNKHNRAVCEKQARKAYRAAAKAMKAKKSKTAKRASRDRRGK